MRKPPSGYVVLIMLMLWLGYSMLLFNTGPYPELVAAADGPLLEEGFHSDQATALQLLTTLGEDGRRQYAKFQLLDILNALLTMLLFTLVLRFVWARLSSATRVLPWLLSLPVLLALAELSENSLLFFMATDFPAIAEHWGSLAGQLTRLKLTLAAVCFLGVVTVSIIWLVKTAVTQLRRKTHQ